MVSIPVSRAATNNSLSENRVLPVPMQLQDRPRASLFPPRLPPLTTAYVNILEGPWCKEHITAAASVWLGVQAGCSQG